jgi:hypothetical protein
MNNKTKSWTFALSGALLLAACSGPILPITPDTLAGCWQGDAAFGLASVKVNITRATAVNTYSVNGEAKAAGATYPISNAQFEYDTVSSELRPSSLPGVVSANLPFKLKVDGAIIRATATGTPLSMDLKRCTTP